MPDSETDTCYRLMYASTSTDFLAEDQIRTLLGEARKNNEAAGITGMLLYVEGHFLQYIEGPRAEVEALAARIEQDPRHHGMLRLLQGQIERRVFADWSMGYRRMAADGHDELKGAVDIARRGVVASLPTDLPSDLAVFMESFYRSSLGRRGHDENR